MALARASSAEAAASSFELAAHQTPLERVPGQVPRSLQIGKELNVALAAGLIDGIVIAPAQVFSYHHAVGRPSRMRGFRDGLELHDGKLGVGVGGGCCAVSNLLYLLAVHAGLKIVERHRHALDLFPDHGRTVPFGCGATVYYNLADLRFENPFSCPVILRLLVRDRHLRGSITAGRDLGVRPGGVASHVFDHPYHLRHADPRWPFLAHLALPEAIYGPLCGHALGYHDRLSPAQVVALFEEAGFQRLLVRRLTLPDRRWVDDGVPLTGEAGLPRRLLARRFRDLSDADLRTAAGHYLFQRPV